jgi:hypothetical protein
MSGCAARKLLRIVSEWWRGFDTWSGGKSEERSFDYAARRAKKRATRKHRATPLRMTRAVGCSNIIDGRFRGGFGALKARKGTGLPGWKTAERSGQKNRNTKNVKQNAKDPAQLAAGKLGRQAATTRSKG